MGEGGCRVELDDEQGEGEGERREWERDKERGEKREREQVEVNGDQGEEKREEMRDISSSPSPSAPSPLRLTLLNSHSPFSLCALAPSPPRSTLSSSLHLSPFSLSRFAILVISSSLHCVHRRFATLQADHPSFDFRKTRPPEKSVPIRDLRTAEYAPSIAPPLSVIPCLTSQHAGPICAEPPKLWQSASLVCAKTHLLS
ncbi:hypothetical protein MRB53_016622 [Persea americana]|uniref:Uncharacterized protein n=1 Tax=Persea americana TaxID=3435 RepID=A0ACC2M380_PERAE|nr:hypothetical protein MRB53_016622 [Persea americana]